MVSCTQYVFIPIDTSPSHPVTAETVTVTPSDTADPNWLTPGAATLPIKDAGDLLAFRDAASDSALAGRTVRLDADFDLSAIKWIPAATGSRDDEALNVFSGMIDGNGHTIKGLTIEGNAKESYGFIGNAGNLTVKDLTLEDVSINAPSGDAVGGLVGYVNGSLTLSNVTIKGSVTGSDGTAGIAGRVYAKDDSDTITLSNVVNNADVSSNVKIGGIFGAISSNDSKYASLTLSNVTNNGDVTAGNDNSGSGGIVGFLAKTEKLSMNNVSNSGSITSGNGPNCSSGGIIGIIAAENTTMEGTLTGLSNTGTITAGHEAGGIIGRVQGTDTIGTIILEAPENSGSISGGASSGGIMGYGRITVRNAKNTGSVTSTGDNGFAGGIAGTIVGGCNIVYPSGGTAAIVGTNAGRIAGRLDSASTAPELYIDNSIVGNVGSVGELGLFDNDGSSLHLMAGDITKTPSFVGARTFHIELDEGTSINLNDEKFGENANVYDGPAKLTIINSTITTD